MKATRYAISRQKACHHCSAAKAKCDRKAGSCTRCSLRGLSCTYPRPLQAENSTQSVSQDHEADRPNLSTSRFVSTPGGQLPTPEHDLPAETGAWSPAVGSALSTVVESRLNTTPVIIVGNDMTSNPGPDAASRSPESFDNLKFADIELFCPINADEISNRWLNTYIPVPGQKVKQYPASITSFIYRILKSYAAVAVHGRGPPPFVHSSQLIETSAKPPLSTCLSLVRVCDKLLPGSESSVVDMLQREMGSLYDQRATYDNLALLAAFQAYLIYSMVLFFELKQGSNPFLRQAMMNLQDLACLSSRRGLMCIAERDNFRPRWEAWIVVEAKRRSLFTMYLFDSTLLAEDNLPTFLGTELRGLLAPASKYLWRAQQRQEWETAYNYQLASWAREGLHIDELWPLPSTLTEPDLLEWRSRVDQWLETVDEFGTVLYTVTSCTHGG